MGRPNHSASISISSTSTALPASSVGSSAPSLIPNKSHFVKKLLLRTTGLLAIVSVVGISSAADTGENKPPPPSKNAQKTTSINLNAGSEQAPNDLNDINKTPDNHTVVGGSTSNSSHSSFNVTVNDHPVAVPENGTNQQVITSPDGGTTTITVNNSTSGQGTNFNSSSTTTNTNTFNNSIHQNTVIEHNFGSP